MKRERNDLVVEWKPFLLRPDMPEEGMELPPEIREKMADSRERLKIMAEASGLKITFSEHVPNSRRALESTEYALDRGRGNEFHGLVFDMLFAEGKDISRWDVLEAAAMRCTLDANDLKSRIENGSYAKILDERLRESLSWGVKAVPTYILNGRYRIVGAQSYEVFAKAIDGIERE